MIDKMLDVRKKYSYGDQDDYFDNPQVVGWVRRTDSDT